MTIKQKRAIGHVLNGDSVSKAMKKAGYTANTAKNPKVLTETAAFTETMEKLGISDKKLVERLNEGLDATKVIVMGKESNESFVDMQPDYAVRHKYLETSLKLKGHTREVPPNNTVIIPIYGGLSARPNEVPLPGYDSDKESIQA